MTIGKVSGECGGIRPLGSRPGESTKSSAGAAPAARHSTDRLEISAESLALRRAQDAARALLVPESDEARSARVSAASQRLQDGAHDEPAVKEEIADRLAGFLGLA